jgi:undecaprenyl-diphosphatase
MSASGSILGLSSSVLQLISVQDHRLMRRVHRWQAPRWIRLLMVVASRAGDGWLWYALGLLILLLGGSSRMAALAAAGLVSGSGLGIYVELKRATGRKRPCVIEPHCWARVAPPDQYSFPSGHTIAAFAIASAVSPFYPPLTLGLFSCALVLALSRIILGMHFLSDVVAGMLIGTSLGFTAYVFMR